MLTRRIAASACVLCLTVPAAAGASQATNPPGTGYRIPSGPPGTVKVTGPYGTVPPGPRSTVKAKGPYGIIPPGPHSTVKAKGPYGIIPPGPRNTVKAKGPYGIIPRFVKGITPASAHGTAGASVRASGAARHDDWRTAAIAEAALLAALVLGSALLLPARRRGARMVT